MGLFIKTLLIWLAISIVCLLCWLRYGGILPEILVSVMPFPEEDVEGVAILLSVMSGVVLLYKGFTMTECGNRLIDHAVQWFKAVYISYLMISMNLLYIPITKQCFTVLELRAAHLRGGAVVPRRRRRRRGSTRCSRRRPSPPTSPC